MNREKDTSALDLNIGADVYGADGRCGKLAKVVIDPGTEEVTDLIVEKGFLQKEDRVLPIDLVTEANADEIHLSCESGELADYPNYDETTYTVPAPDWRNERYGPAEVRYWVRPYGFVIGDLVVPKVRQVVHEGIPSTVEAIGHGTPVRHLTEELGVVDHLLVDRESGEIAHLVVRRPGLIPDYRILPIDVVQEIDEAGIYVDLDEEAMEDQPKYSPRS